MDRRQMVLMLPLAVLSPASSVATVQSYPNRPISLIVGGAPGSVPDTMIRPIAESLGRALGQAIVIENKPGAGGILAMSALTRSVPDGHTLALATMSQAVFNSYLFAKLPYDPVLDLAPITPLVSGAMALAAHPQFPANSIGELIAMSKNQPRKLLMAIPPLGSPPHIIAMMMNRAAVIDATLVPYKSGSDAISAVLSGDVPLVIDAPTVISPQVHAGKLKAIVVTGAAREPLLAATPTAAERGLDISGEAWIGLVAPKGTPQAIVSLLNSEVSRILVSEPIKNSMAKFSFRTLNSTPDAFAKLIADDHAKWGQIIRESGIKLE